MEFVSFPLGHGRVELDSVLFVFEYFQFLRSEKLENIFQVPNCGHGGIKPTNLTHYTHKYGQLS